MAMTLPFYKSYPKIAILLVCLTSAPAQADDLLDPIHYKGPVVMKGIFICSITGVPFGKLGIEISQNDREYSVAADIMSTGIVNLFARHTSHSMVKGTGTNYVYPDKVYESHYTTKKKRRHVKLTYQKGKIVDEIVVPPDNRDKRPAVPADLRDPAYDPLSFILAMRHSLYMARKEGKKTFTVDAYDGRRLTRADFTIAGTDVIEYKGEKLPVIHVTAKRSLIAGFTKSEMEDHAESDDPLLHVYFTNDARQMPVQLFAEFWMGTIRADLVSECGAGESCLFGISE